MYRRAALAPDSSKVYDETYVGSLRYAKNGIAYRDVARSATNVSSTAPKTYFFLITLRKVVSFKYCSPL